MTDIAKFDPTQPRDMRGRWVDIPGGGGALRQAVRGWRYGKPSLLDEDEITNMSIADQLDLLVRIQGQASAGGDYQTATRAMDEIRAIRLRLDSPELFRKARKVRDADGDGWVYDNTPKKRPATPAEKVPGGVKRPKGDDTWRRHGPQARDKMKYVVVFQPKGGKGRANKVFQNRAKAVEFAQQIKAMGAKNIIAYPEDHPEYKRIANKPLRASDRESGKIQFDTVIGRRRKKPANAADAVAAARRNQKPGGTMEAMGRLRRKPPKNARLGQLYESEDNEMVIKPIRRRGKPGNVADAVAAARQNQKPGGTMDALQRLRGQPAGGTQVRPKAPKGGGGGADPFFGRKLNPNDPRDGVLGHWADAMFAAEQGDQQKYEANMQAILELEKDHDVDWTNDAMDEVDDLMDQKYGDKFVDNAVKNIKKWKRLPSQMRSAKKKEAAPKRVEATNTPADVKSGAAYKHLAAGGSIDDAPSDGLFEAVKAMPERFDVMPNGDKGISPNWWVVDKDNETDTEVAIKSGRKTINTANEVWVFKGRSEDYKIDEDILNEQMGYMVQKGIGMQAPKTKWATRADADPPMMAQRHYEQAIGGEGAVFGVDKVLDLQDVADIYGSRKHIADLQFDVGEGQGFLEKLNNPEQMLEMNLFDFLIGNVVDRHMKNWMVVGDLEGGFNIAVIDNGFSFIAPAEKGVQIQDYEKFTKFVGNAPWNKFNMRLGAIALGNDPKKVEAAVRKFVTRAKKLDVEKMKKELAKGGLSERQDRLMRQQLDLMQDRIQYLEDHIDDVVRVVTTG